MAGIFAKVGLKAAPFLEKYTFNPKTAEYLNKISKNVTLDNADKLLNHAQTLSNVYDNYNNNALNLGDAQNLLNITHSYRKSGGNYEKLNKKGIDYINRIQKEFRNKLNENYYKLITGGSSKKALKSFNRAGIEYGNKLIDKYLAKLENHALKGGYSPHIVRNLLTKYGGTLPSKLNKLIKKANKKIEDDDKKLKMVFNARNYMGGVTRTIDFSNEDAVLSENADMPSFNESRAVYNEFITPNREEIINMDSPVESEVAPTNEMVVVPEPEIVMPENEMVVVSEPEMVMPEPEMVVVPEPEMVMPEPEMVVVPEPEIISEPEVVPEPEIVVPVDSTLPSAVQGADLTNVTATPELISEINELSEPTNAEAENIAAAKLALAQPTEQETEVLPVPTNAEAENIAAAKLALAQPTEQETEVLPVEKTVVIRDEILSQPTEVPDNVNERLNKLQNQLNKLRNKSNDNDSDSDKSYKINFKPIITMTMNGSDNQKKNMN